MRFIFYSPVHFERWDWRNSVEKGIGGSETSHVEMAWRLAARGHEVITYAPIPDDCPGTWRNTTWKRLEEVDTTLDGIWVIYRDPEFLDKFEDSHPGKQLWLVHQDWDYPTLTEARMAKMDRYVILCKWHARYIAKKYPYQINEKTLITSNGLKPELLDEVEEEKVPRNPKRIMYASSPDRGLKNLLEIFTRAREYVPDLELHAFYGFNNIDKLIEQPGWQAMKAEKEAIMAYEHKPGVFFHGRVSQQTLYRHWLASGIWCYPTNFHETSCITSMEAQALGAIPITNPVAALAENVLHGVFVPGNADDKLVKARYAAELVRLATDPELQERIRKPMERDARERFSWENFVDQWETVAAGKAWPAGRFPFQL